ncbi:MAG TPA: substrate-binding domain-containing protein [Gemmatimonas sp.]|nr:substrate-binding domain-containing protein [Gemmatimonas sp.]
MTSLSISRRAIGATILAAALSLLTAACNRGADAGKKPVVALVLKTLNNPFFVDMEAGAKAAADSLGFELIVQAPDRETDVARQMEIVENLLQRGISVLALVPNGAVELVPAIAKANAAKIPVVIVDSRVDSTALAAANATTVTFIGSDNEDGGRVAGSFLSERLNGTGRVVVLEGIPGHESGDARLRGFRAALASSPGMVIVSSQTSNAERDQAFNVMQNLLQSNADITGVFACNDVMALGAVEAIAAAGRTGQIAVVGFDAQDDARKAITEGRMAGTIAQSPREMGRMAVLTAARILKGEPIPKEQPVPIALVKAEATGALSFRAAGNEPGWLLTMSDATLQLRWNYDEQRATVRAPARETISGGARYRVTEGATRFVLAVRDTTCADAMSGHLFPASVTVQFDSGSARDAGTPTRPPTRTLTGCGGEPAASLRGAEWSVDSLLGKPLIAGSSVSLRFGSDGKVSGSASCNRYSATFTVIEAGLMVRNATTTRRSCEPQVNDQEQTFLRLLEGTMPYYIDENGRLVTGRADAPGFVARRR